MYSTFMGNLGRDAELKSTQNGKSYVKFSVAETVGYGEKQTTQWITCLDWRASSQGEKVIAMLSKGARVMVNGNVTLNEYTDRDGTLQKSLQCNVNDFRMCGGASEKKAASNEPASADTDDIPF